MKHGLTLSQLAAEIERQADAKKDYVVDTAKAQAVLTDNGAVALEFGNHSFPINDHAHRQIGARLQLPAPYYDRMRADAPQLLVTNVNTWLHQEPEKRLVRVLDGKVRAFVSDSFSLDKDNIDFASAVLPVLQTMDIQVHSCQLTATKLYLKVVDNNIQAQIPAGKKFGDGSHAIFDTVSPALVLSNSEVGSGSAAIEAGVWTKACANLAVFAERSVRKYHVGAKHEMTTDFAEMLSHKTRELTQRAFFAQVQDVVKGAFAQAKFDSLVVKLKGATDNRIPATEVEAVLEITAKKYSLSEGQRNSVLTHLIEGGDLSQYGLSNAVTRSAEDQDDYETASDLERLGGKIIEAEWSEFLKAA